jgi:hypothetical protein
VQDSCDFGRIPQSSRLAGGCPKTRVLAPLSRTLTPFEIGPIRQTVIRLRDSSSDDAEMEGVGSSAEHTKRVSGGSCRTPSASAYFAYSAVRTAVLRINGVTAGLVKRAHLDRTTKTQNDL